MNNRIKSVLVILPCLILIACPAPVDTTKNSPEGTFTSFGFASPPVEGKIFGTWITLRIPSSADIRRLTASFTTTGKSVRVGETVQASGLTVNDFSGPVIYTVTGENGRTLDHAVLVDVTYSITTIQAIPSGLGSNTVNNLAVSDSTVYAATSG